MYHRKGGKRITAMAAAVMISGMAAWTAGAESEAADETMIIEETAEAASDESAEGANGATDVAQVDAAVNANVTNYADETGGQQEAKVYSDPSNSSDTAAVIDNETVSVQNDQALSSGNDGSAGTNNDVSLDVPAASATETDTADTAGGESQVNALDAEGLIEDPDASQAETPEGGDDSVSDAGQVQETDQIVAFPAVTLENIPVEGSDVTLTITAEEGILPKGVCAQAQTVETPGSVLSQSAENAEAFSVRIRFYLPENPDTEIQPSGEVSITMHHLSLNGERLNIWESTDDQPDAARKISGGMENAQDVTVKAGR